ncbi:MAG: hypothetical protein HGA85_07070, partial [Nanoarchaeota archaeon]|nr:hypothetical protein [Nanoarchaeota archaeon]
MMKKVVLLLLLLLVFQAHAKSGSMKLLAVSNGDTDPKGSIADLELEIKEGRGRIFIDSFPLSRLDTQISTRFAKEVACNFLEADCSRLDFFYTIRANSALIGGPSASAATTILTISVLGDIPLDKDTTITGTINTGGIIGPVGGIESKVDAASKTGLKKVLVPKFSQLNLSNISEYKEKYKIEIVEVSQLEDALQEMTGREFRTAAEISVSSYYIETM